MERTGRQHTLDTSVVRLHEGLRDLAILSDKRVPLAPVAAEDSRAIERELEGIGEVERRISDEADL